MAIQSTTLRPGLLVSLKTSLTGNVTYAKTIIEPEHKTADGAERAKWETERTIENKAEHERAQKAQSKAGSLIRAICAKSAFGLLCPESREGELEAAIAEARAVADAFNATAELSRVGVYVITGRVAPDDVEAVRAINSEVRDLMSAMAQGVERVDVKAIRDAADRARQLGAMLPPETEARVKIAIDTARDAARKIVKAGETAAREIDTSAVRKITEMRTTFLDLDAIEATRAPQAAPGRGIDLAPETVTREAAPPSSQFQMEL